MDKLGQQFGEIIAQRLKALETNAFAVETASGLPPDAIRNVIRSEKKSGPTLSRAQEICAALGLELYIGPKRDDGPVTTITADDEDYAHIPLHEASLAAGDGSQNGAVEIIDHLAFRRSWLKRIGVSAGSAVLARVQGDSMAPSIQSGDIVLIDRSRAAVPVRPRAPNDKRPAPIYAILVDGLARVKRIERPSEDITMLVSDNPSCSPELLTGHRAMELDVIGKVMWWGHTNRE
ncbi:S24 family peptidase [Pseudogemmobacter blasticus]|uniref:Peptidase n=1 Tax=Fuscovulum blasticum DSM 2131 TaxID=1188250 RepID=A0A2T4JDS1_FUSBL|nr:S24 family peptidase [Fuscovulum blasticum]PTE15967.1 peptidase [Fuscovulum blasticum DSM 2131]